MKPDLWLPLLSLYDIIIIIIIMMMMIMIVF